MPFVSIIVLNWNGGNDTIECVASLLKITFTKFNLIIVDNGSDDSSVEKIDQYLSEDQKKQKLTQPINRLFSENIKEITQYSTNSGMIVDFIICNKNYGFAKGNNIGLNYALKIYDPDYFLILNNDTIVDPDFLAELVNIGESDSKIGILGPKVYYFDFKGLHDIINFAGGRIDFVKGETYHIGINQVDNGDYDEIIDVDFVQGVCLLIKTKVISDIGFLKDYYFAYWEEVDWCIRGRKEGYKIVYVPHAKIWHKISVSTRKISGFQTYYMTRNYFFLLKENADKTTIVKYWLFFLFFKFWFVFFFIITSSHYSEIVPFFKAIQDGILYRKEGWIGNK